MSAIKILHVLDHSIPLHSGYTFRTRSILNHQRLLGYQTAHVTGSKHTPYESPQETVDDLIFYRTQEGALSRFPVINQYDVVRTLTRRIKEVIKIEKPDIIHAHSPALNGLAALQAAKHFNLPVVYEVRAFWEDAAVDHGTTKEDSLRYNLTRYLETRVMEKAQAITCICHGLKTDIIERGFNKNKITIIPNAVNIEQFEFDRPKDTILMQELGLNDEVVIGFIGSFYAYEGIDLLIKAIKKVNSNIKLLLVGGGNEAEHFQQLISELSLNDKVIMTGRVPHSEVSRYYDILDILIYPRKPMRLTELVTPLKPLESMAKGRLVIASDVGGHRELIQHDKTGFMFPANDIDALAETIDRVIQQKETWSTIKKTARDYVEHERNWKKSVEHYVSVYEGLLN